MENNKNISSQNDYQYCGLISGMKRQKTINLGPDNINNRSIIEITGEAGTGKSKLCYYFALNTIMPEKYNGLEKCCLLVTTYIRLTNEKLDLEIGGSKGFEESIKAYKTGMSQAGFRFRKVPKENDELNEAQAKAYEEEIKGIATGDDFLALSGFIKREKLLQENSEIEEY